MDSQLWFNENCTNCDTGVNYTLCGLYTHLQASYSTRGQRGGGWRGGCVRIKDVYLVFGFDWNGLGFGTRGLW